MPSPAKRSFSVSVAPSPLIFATYRHFPYTLGEALAEMIDNSTQSFFDHRHELARPRVNVSIEYSHDAASNVRVCDDAFGMNEADLRRALRLAEPPPDTSGRSEFGMGLKTSCCWLGDSWTIQTKQLGHRYEYSTTFDVRKIGASIGSRIVVNRRNKPRDEHYTILEITNLHREYHTRTIAKAKERLAQAYQRDLRKKLLRLTFNGIPLVASEPELLRENGREVRTDFSFRVGSHRIKGWVGLLAQGKGSSAAGFDIFRRGRLIVPHFKFIGPGLYPEVTTNVIHQRLVGSIDLDTVPVVHLKNGIDLRNIQEEFEGKLATAIQHMRGRAIALRYEASGRASISNEQSHVDDLIAATKTEVTSSNNTHRELAHVKSKTREIGKRVFANHEMRFYLAPGDEAEPYVQYKDGSEISVFVNTLHPAFKLLDGYAFEGFLDEIMHDVVAQITAGKSGDWIRIKDEVLRADAAHSARLETSGPDTTLLSAS